MNEQDCLRKIDGTELVVGDRWAIADLSVSRTDQRPTQQCLDSGHA